jgi:hypothetical protein
MDTGVSFPGEEMIQRPGHEAEHQLPISSEVKYEWIYTSNPVYSMVCTGMTLPSVRMDVPFSGCAKLFNVCLTEYDLCIL